MKKHYKKYKRKLTLKEKILNYLLDKCLTREFMGGFILTVSWLLGRLVE